MTVPCRFAYFSMEIAVHPDVPTYSGGLGMLAGDTLRSAADLQLPMVGITLLSRQGYFHQRLDDQGNQTEHPVRWPIDDFLCKTEVMASVTLREREVSITAWRYDVTGEGGGIVPVYFLDTDVEGNHPDDRRLTDQLYGGDREYRLCQEAVLGIGGLRILRKLGHDAIERIHLNEGHPALATIELLRELRLRESRETWNKADIEQVRRQCVFTTHTPVPAGHDQFDLELVQHVLGMRHEYGLSDEVCHAGQLNMTYLALSLSRYVNGVALKHSEVSNNLFASYTVDAITNGVHAATWVSPAFAKLYDRYMPNWRRSNFSFRYAVGIPDNDLWQAHQESKRHLVSHVNHELNAGFDVDVLTLGFARRATAYKRPTLIFEDVERLIKMAQKQGRVQLIFAGKAHPNDTEGKSLIRELFAISADLPDDVKLAFLPNYDQRAGLLMTTGVDVWLNTPEPPLEASGTSGMKAALNGVPSLSVLDGWWIEGCVEGVTGWSIGQRNAQVHGANAASLYEKLEQAVLPTFYQERESFIAMMRHSIALNASFFNTERMLHEYMVKAYYYPK